MSFLRPAAQHKGIYQNPVPTDLNFASKMPTMLRRLLSGTEERTPRRQLGPFRTDPAVFRQPSTSGLRITLIGHSTLLLEIDGTTVLIDPVFSDRASFTQRFGPKRFYPPPLPIAGLPPLDAILLTHDHYDHLDTAAVQQLAERTPLFVCSQGIVRHLRRWGIQTPVHEMNWMDTFTVPSSSALPLTLTALPARHFSGRGPRRNRTLWSSFVLRTGRHNVYHGADSGYWPGFREIGERFGPFDLATLEIGAFDPLWSNIHLGPDNALAAAGDLRAKVLFPIHWGLFNLAFHSWFQPAERITQIAEAAGLPLLLPRPGTPVDFNGNGENTRWWQAFLA